VLRNSFAHLIARMAALAAGIATIPLVTLTLGTEALGLVGVYSTLVAMLGFFDLGLPVAVNHRLAVLIGRNAPSTEKAELVRTLEALFWGMVPLFLVAGLGLCGPFASSWLNVGTMPRSTVDTALVVIMFAAAVRFPVTFYANVLFAHERHVVPNVVTAGSAIFRFLASTVALVWFDVGAVGFFLIQLIGSIAEVTLLAGIFWFAQPCRWVTPRWTVIRDIGAMAGGLTLISLTAVILSQVDKIILSKVLSLGDFGLYSAGYTLAAGLVALSYPVGNAIFPSLSRSLDGKIGETIRIVRAATELNILILVPLGCVLMMQTEPLLRLLFLVKPMPDGLTAILPLMMLGGLSQAFVTLPHLFQVAAGRVATVVWINIGFLVPYGVGVLIGTLNAGVIGAAAAFATFNIARLLVHWGVLLAGHRTRSLWSPAILLAVTMLVGGLILAGLPRLFEAQGLTAIFVAVSSVPVLVVLAGVLMPTSRERLAIIRRTGIAGRAVPDA
jgi:O-antigen/teichoic acid export membrane protein